jgi:adenylylsulfate kinase
VELLLITGTVGIGKTAAVSAVSELLTRRDMSHVAVDMDWLCVYWPWVEGDPHNRLAGRTALSTMAEIARARGVTRMVVAEVLEHPDDVVDYRLAVQAERVLIVRLTGTTEVLKARIAGRGRANQDGNLARAQELDGLLASRNVGELVLDTSDISPPLLADAIVTYAGWVRD